MEGNLIKREYDIPNDKVYNQGPYLHSVAKNFLTNSYYIDELEEQHYLNRLYQHLDAALKREREFYDLVGVRDASEFSRKFLYGFNPNLVNADDENRDIKILQKVLININSSLALVSGKAKSKLAPTLDKLADQIVENNPEFKAIQKAAGQKGVQILFEYLNANVGKGKGQIKVTGGQTAEVDFPKRKLRSEYGSYIMKLLAAEDPTLHEQFMLTPQQKINKYKDFFFMSCKSEDMETEKIEKYWARLNKQLLSLKAHKDNKGNISAFSNPYGAEGALGEIAIAITLEDVFEGKAAVNVLANDMVQSVKQEFNATESGAQVSVSKNGEPVKLNYKSPTDLLVTVGSRAYPIQIKTSYTELTAEKALKLQGSIYLTTLLGNMVSQGYLSSDTAQLLVYTVANLSTNNLQDFGDTSAKEEQALRILQMCMEYFAESHYTREISNTISKKKPDTNMGNMFFIYSGNLIPMSSFILAAISALNGDQLVIKGSYKDIVTYGKTYSLEDIEQENFAGRIAMGTNVYEQTKLKELSFVIAQMDQRILRSLQ